MRSSSTSCASRRTGSPGYSDPPGDPAAARRPGCSSPPAPEYPQAWPGGLMLQLQRAVRVDKMRRTEVDVTAEAATGLGAGFASLPSWTLDENQLADLEMLLSGVFAPLTGFMTAADVSAVCESGTLADGFPLAVLDISERSPALMPSTAPAGRGGRHARPVGTAPSAGPGSPAATG